MMGRVRKENLITLFENTQSRMTNERDGASTGRDSQSKW